ncbi:leucine-rich repeat-containing protein 15-like [Bradysia coprophila]|uniref:leucine-rich repeat-containing protein 15-like n=1 Tax=Bradysia coprophila TaxID=38358 RepID=UPI00187DAE43|nr:leucine-rich repeat-containing protein 15-like [Bradysia coprophila]
MFAKLVTLTTVPLLIIVALTDIRTIEAVTCTYELSETSVYSCNLINQTILTERDMDAETGTHMPGFTNENVTLFISLTSVIEIFPSTLINRFVNLDSVALFSVRMKQFTSPIGNCDHLINIVLMLNQITSVPGNIFQNCRQLTDIFLDVNTISHIDIGAFTGLTRLRRLSLTNNQISYLDPLVFQPIRNLTILNLDSNLIWEVRAETFGLLPLLTNLTLNANSITTWTSTFHNSNQALQELRLDRNQISSLSSDTFANLPQLKTLRVGDSIEELPTFSGLNSLEELWLNYNKLKVISADSFKNLKSLRLLQLSFNNIESVNFTLTPTTAGSLPNLTSLNLLFNSITEIPDGTFTLLTNLRDLNLCRNRIEFLSAESIRPIIQIRTLDVAFNQIARIERDLFAGVTNLTFRSQRNVCFDGDVSIGSSDDFENGVDALLEPCFSFATSLVGTNVFLLVGALIFANKVASWDRNL